MYYCLRTSRPAFYSDVCCVHKLAFTDSDSDSPDSADTSIHSCVRYARFPREDPREEVRVGVGVSVVECQL